MKLIYTMPAKLISRLETKAQLVGAQRLAELIVKTVAAKVSKA